MSLPPRFITVLSLLQFFFVISGYLFVRMALRHLDPGVHLRPGPLGFVSTFGLSCLLVPVVWYCAVLFRHRRDPGTLTVPDIVTGVAITIAIAVVFSLGAIRALFGGW